MSQVRSTRLSPEGMRDKAQDHAQSTYRTPLHRSDGPFRRIPGGLDSISPPLPGWRT